MTIRTSKIILGIETLIIALPLTLLFLVGVLPTAFYGVTHFPDADSFAFASVNLVVLATLCCAWTLILSFTVRGSGALRRFSIYWWALPFFAAGIAIAVTIKLWVSETIEPSAINTFGSGLPFLIPLLHLSLERWLRLGANTYQAPGGQE